ncbi:dUTP diphosphatase [Fluviispira multicolorata]|uniref:dUTP diphosphatase n=1 Tax=Fluviispira multicolorata TaxID=2654512 RepID=A0A833N0R6_9BACT|nr:dUTP diphosphatase [Fluviispira multicolorata]KAB8029166.1 dUTP diphosphatase [Fluviispira multicolorata]
MLKLEHLGTGEIFYATKQSAGFDICSNQTLVLKSKAWTLVKTGLKIIQSIDTKLIKIGTDEYYGVPEIQIRPRSGLALKYGVTVLNSPSTIDADYRGEIMVTLINHSEVDFEIKEGDRIAQGICSIAIQIPNIKVKDVERGVGGFGSSGRS